MYGNDWNVMKIFNNIKNVKSSQVKYNSSTVFGIRHKYRVTGTNTSYLFLGLKMETRVKLLLE